MVFLRTNFTHNLKNYVQYKIYIAAHIKPILKISLVKELSLKTTKNQYFSLKLNTEFSPIELIEF